METALLNSPVSKICRQAVQDALETTKTVSEDMISELYRLHYDDAGRDYDEKTAVIRKLQKMAGSIVKSIDAMLPNEDVL